ncbi:hypothetical protein HHI36_003930, partial [Cryptolaemus montrouzieri]
MESDRAKKAQEETHPTARIRAEKEERQQQYQDLNKRVKRSAKRDKREWTEQPNYAETEWKNEPTSQP